MGVDNPKGIGGPANPYKVTIQNRSPSDATEALFDAIIGKRDLEMHVELDNYNGNLSFGEKIDAYKRFTSPSKQIKKHQPEFNAEAIIAAQNFKDQNGLQQLEALTSALENKNTNASSTYGLQLRAAQKGVELLLTQKSFPVLAQGDLLNTAALTGIFRKINRENPGDKSIKDLADTLHQTFESSGFKEQCQLAWQAGDPPKHFLR